MFDSIVHMLLPSLSRWMGVLKTTLQPMCIARNTIYARSLANLLEELEYLANLRRVMAVPLIQLNLFQTELVCFEEAAPICGH